MADDMDMAREFAASGYCIYRQAVPQAMLEPLRRALAAHVEARVTELVDDGLAPDAHADAPLERRWALVVDDCLAAGPPEWSEELPPFLAQGGWGAPTGRGNQRGSGGPYFLLEQAVHDLYTCEPVVAIASALLPSAERLRCHGDYWFRPSVSNAVVASGATVVPPHQDAGLQHYFHPFAPPASLTAVRRSCSVLRR